MFLQNNFLFLTNVKFGSLISAKGPHKYQDQFADGFVENGRRINLKLHNSMSMFDIVS